MISWRWVLAFGIICYLGYEFAAEKQHLIAKELQTEIHDKECLLMGRRAVREQLSEQIAFQDDQPTVELMLRTKLGVIGPDETKCVFDDAND